eukprot:2721700-Rhodomonas_salina.1
MVTTAELIYPASVDELHDSVLRRLDKQSPVCVLSADEELAAYVRSLRRGCPEWKVSSVQGTDPKAAPTDFGEDWKLEGSQWYARRVQPVSLGPAACAVTMKSRGQIANLQVQEARRCAQPAAGWVEVRVHAVGLNFRDVLNVLGMYPGDPGQPGTDFAGVIVQLGEGVSDLEVGARVFGFAPGAFQGYVLARRANLLPMPDTMQLEQAASMPSLITTVEHAMIDCAQLRRGQRILIHAGTGGVGLTAIWYAQKLGCEIVATAGSEEKRKFLRRM